MVLLELHEHQGVPGVPESGAGCPGPRPEGGEQGKQRSTGGTTWIQRGEVS